MFSLHVPARLVPITRSFARVDRRALLVLLAAVFSGFLIVAAFVSAA